jgi:cytochrome c-type biogenesis protein CcmE
MLAQGSKAYGPTIRLGGVVQPGSLHWDAATTHLSFRVADSDTPGGPASVQVVSRERPRRCSAERIGVRGGGNASTRRRRSPRRG